MYKTLPGRSTHRKAIFCALLAAALYALSTPTSKLLLRWLSSPMMAAYLYLGAGLGMLVVGLVRRGSGKNAGEAHVTKKELPYLLGMVVLDIAAPILLMSGLRTTSAAHTALLNNFEIVATSLIAMIFFRESISKRVWLAIAVIVLASALLSFEDMGSLVFSRGSLLVLGACICWGLENNCTRRLSVKDPLEVVVIKGLGSGTGAFIIAMSTGSSPGRLLHIACALLIGFISYGLSIYFYVYAQRTLGAARTSTYYAIAPFLGVFLSFLFFREIPNIWFFVALALMLLGTYLSTTENYPEQSR